VNTRYTINGNDAENTVYFEYIAAITQEELDGIVDYMSVFFGSVLRPDLKSTVVGRETYGVDLTAQDGLYSVDTSISGLAGALTSLNNVPASVAPCISFRTAQRGRSGRGRNYLPSPAAQQLTSDNLLSTTYMSDMISNYLNLRDDPRPDWTWVVVSRFAGGGPRVAGVTFPITSVAFADNVVDTQRRRLH